MAMQKSIKRLKNKNRRGQSRDLEILIDSFAQDV
jgi:hypothetical protein